MQDALARLLDGHDLSRDEARGVMDEVMRGAATPGQIGGLLVALRLKGETADEIAGCAEAMRAPGLPGRPARRALAAPAARGAAGPGPTNPSPPAAPVAPAPGPG